MKNAGVVDRSPLLRFVWLTTVGLWYLGIVAAMLFPVIALVALLAPPAATFEIRLNATADLALVESAPGVALHGGPIDPRISRFEAPVLSGTMADLQTGTKLLMLSTMACAIAIVLSMVGILRRLLASIREARPFDPANARRLKSLGGIVIVAGPLLGFLHYLVTSSVIQGSEALAAGLRPDLDVHFITVVLGLLIVVIGGVFEVGFRLQREQELTI